MPMTAATVATEYSKSSVIEATMIAVLCKVLSVELINTKKMMSEIMVKTMMKIPQKRPLLALEQSME